MLGSDMNENSAINEVLMQVGAEVICAIGYANKFLV